MLLRHYLYKGGIFIKKIYVLLTLFLLVLTSCSKDKIDTSTLEYKLYNQTVKEGYSNSYDKWTKDLENNNIEYRYIRSEFEYKYSFDWTALNIDDQTFIEELLESSLYTKYYIVNFIYTASNILDDMEVVEGNTINIAKLDDEYPNIFFGWYLDSKVYDFNTPITKDITLEAVWTAMRYVITYELDGGINSLDNMTSCSPSTKEFILKDPTKEGYVFEGWYSNRLYTGDRITKITPSELRDDLVLYAKFILKDYTITYVLDGGTNSIDNKDTYIANEVVILHDPTKEGYIFEGWYGSSNFSTIRLYKVEYSSANIVLYAKFTKIETGY